VQDEQPQQPGSAQLGDERIRAPGTTRCGACLLERRRLGDRLLGATSPPRHAAQYVAARRC
jgi:hypothetical protein